MKREHLSAILVCVAVLIVAGAVVWYVRRPPNLYRTTILPSLGGDLTTGCAINDRGQVVGIATTKDHKYHLFLWDRGHGTRDLGVADGWFDINNAGQISGAAADPNGNPQAFLWEPGKDRTPLGTLGGKTSHAWAINNRGQIVGTSETSGGLRHAFLWDRVHGMQDLGTLTGTEFQARAINDAGQVLGLRYSLKSKYQHFLWDPNEGMIAIGPLPPGTQLNSLNSGSWTVGEANDLPSGRRMVAWSRNAGIRDLFLLDLPLYYLAHLNDLNQIVYSERSADRPSWVSRKLLPSRIRRKYFVPYTPCYLWDPNCGKIPLNPYIPAGAMEFFVPTGINNNGCIIGAVESRTKVPRARAVLLEPIRERWGK